jgi:Holliday junction DNA helicase RuvB
MTFRLEHYEPDELALIVRRSARILGVEISGDASTEIAGRARGTPRIANRILRRVRDVAEVRHQGKITVEIAREALELMEVDGDGPRALRPGAPAGDRREVRRRPGRPFDAGGDARRGADTIEDVYEPYLLQLGFIQRTPRGRIVTKPWTSPRRCARQGGRRAALLAGWNSTATRSRC